MRYFWINIDQSTTRKEFMEKQFKHLNIPNTRVSAITPEHFPDVLEHKPPYFCGNPECLETNKKNCAYEYACLSSHIKALQIALETTTDEYFVIIEDDIFIPFEIDFPKFISQAPKDFELIQMMVLYAPTVKVLYEQLYKNNVNFIRYQPILPSTGQYLISRIGAEKLVKLYVNDNNKYDFSKYHNIKVADILLYTSIISYTTTFPYIYPYIQMGSEIHPDHLHKHQQAIDEIKKAIKGRVRDDFILTEHSEDYLESSSNLSLKK